MRKEFILSIASSRTEDKYFVSIDTKSKMINITSQTEDSIYLPAVAGFIFSDQIIDLIGEMKDPLDPVTDKLAVDIANGKEVITYDRIAPFMEETVDGWGKTCVYMAHVEILHLEVQNYFVCNRNIYCKINALRRVLWHYAEYRKKIYAEADMYVYGIDGAKEGGIESYSIKYSK